MQTAWLFPSATSTPTALGGASSWANTVRVTASDNVRATTTASGSATVSTRVLRCQGFGVTYDVVPPNSLILGVEVAIEGYVGIEGSHRDQIVSLIKGANDSAGDRLGANLASDATWLTTEGVRSYGSSNDTWGATLLAMDVIDPNFGLDLQLISSITGTRTLYLDSISLRLTYQPVPRRHKVRRSRATFY